MGSLGNRNTEKENLTVGGGKGSEEGAWRRQRCNKSEQTGIHSMGSVTQWCVFPLTTGMALYLLDQLVAKPAKSCVMLLLDRGLLLKEWFDFPPQSSPQLLRLHC